MLPTDTPRPLEVRGSGVGPGGRESIERTMERGVKVKWPSKRMSVGDMNKRVRALVEWVGREQANALDRGRRRDALEKALCEAANGAEGCAPGSMGVQNDDLDTGEGDAREGRDAPMVLDGESSVGSPLQEKMMIHPPGITSSLIEVDANCGDSVLRFSTMKMMEELMEELIGFQERFGPGAKTRERERRLAGT